jgi:predicted Zn-dependent protease
MVSGEIAVPRELKHILQTSLAKALKQRDLTRAESVLFQLKKEDPFSLKTCGLELEYLQLAGRLEEAACLAKQLVQSFPQSSRIHFLAGQVACQQKRYGEAEKLFSESNRLYPSDKSLLWIAKAEINAGQLEQAEALLLDLVSRNPRCHSDLAWLYERKGDFPRAESEITTYLEKFPDQNWAKTKQKQLQAKMKNPEEVLEELDDLSSYGEEIPQELDSRYLESLWQTGKICEAREFVKKRLPNLDAKHATDLGWRCYFAQVYDLAFELFYKAFPAQLRNDKFLKSFQLTARRCSRVPELLKLYEQYAPQNGKLYGHIKDLRIKHQL